MRLGLPSASSLEQTQNPAVASSTFVVSLWFVHRYIFLVLSYPAEGGGKGKPV
jgi:hypothetical protein